MGIGQELSAFCPPVSVKVSWNVKGVGGMGMGKNWIYPFMGLTLGDLWTKSI